MKVCIVLLACLCVVFAENCTTNNDCNSTTCNTGSHVICQHPPGGGVVTNGGLCTCALNDYSCVTQADCAVHWEALNCISAGHAHCYDAKCICSRW